MGGTMCRFDRKAGQIGRRYVPLPWFVVNAVKSAVREAEEILGEPANIPEITLILEKTSPMIASSAFFVGGLLSELLREDLVYTEKMC